MLVQDGDFRGFYPKIFSIYILIQSKSPGMAEKWWLKSAPPAPPNLAPMENNCSKIKLQSSEICQRIFLDEKWNVSCKRLQNLPQFWNTKKHIVFSFFINISTFLQENYFIMHKPLLAPSSFSPWLNWIKYVFMYFFPFFKEIGK